MPKMARARAFDLFLAIDRTPTRPLGRQIEDQLRAAIRSGRLRPGREVPSTRALARDLSVWRGVVVRAYAQLELILRLGTDSAP
jgi:GntR family transcriptional regulator / MocR family aminotransferase